VSIEERILNIVEEPVQIWWQDKLELRAIALDVRKLEDRLKQLEDALRKIANQDYRGNRSTESQIAFEALKP
jgi:hypothetical protein